LQSKICARRRAVACVFGVCASFGAHALDSFDPATGRLSMDSVSVNGTTYSNVVVTLNAFTLLGVSGGTPSADSFDPATNTLVLGAVSFQGNTYNNVRARVDSYALTASTYSDCATNSVLTTVGSSSQIIMQGSDQTVTSTTGTVNRLTTFNGNSALEVQTDIAVLTGSATGSTSSTKSYQQVLPTSAVTYGAAQTLFSPTQGTLVQTSTYSPAIQSPLSLAINTPFSQTYGISVTSPTAGSASVSQTQSITFLGMESITVPAGSFMTCKIRSDSQSITANVAVTMSGTIWRVASGPYRGMTVKSLDNRTGVQAVATKLTLNGS